MLMLFRRVLAIARKPRCAKKAGACRKARVYRQETHKIQWLFCTNQNICHRQTVKLDTKCSTYVTHWNPGKHRVSGIKQGCKIGNSEKSTCSDRGLMSVCTSATGAAPQLKIQTDKISRRFSMLTTVQQRVL